MLFTAGRLQLITCEKNTAQSTERIMQV